VQRLIAVIGEAVSQGSAQRKLSRATSSGQLRVTVLIALAVSVTACGGGDVAAPVSDAQPEEPVEMRITVTDDGYEMPAELEAEPVSLTLQNEGNQAHRADFARLNEGVSKDEIRSVLAEGPRAIFPLITIAGSIEVTQPGATREVGMIFPQGDYILLDSQVNGRPPMSFFSVTAARGPKVEEQPSDYSIEVGEYYFEVSEPASGRATVEITNAGQQSHEVGILPAGAKPEGPELTTVFAPAPGGKMWVPATLEPGEYTLVCFLPDLKTGKPHVRLGMRQNIRV
jgi:hypothetical protein